LLVSTRGRDFWLAGDLLPLTYTDGLFASRAVVLSKVSKFLPVKEPLES